MVVMLWSHEAGCVLTINTWDHNTWDHNAWSTYCDNRLTIRSDEYISQVHSGKGQLYYIVLHRNCCITLCGYNTTAVANAYTIRKQEAPVLCVAYIGIVCVHGAIVYAGVHTFCVSIHHTQHLPHSNTLPLLQKISPWSTLKTHTQTYRGVTVTLYRTLVLPVFCTIIRCDCTTRVLSANNVTGCSVVGKKRSVGSVSCLTCSNAEVVACRWEGSAMLLLSMMVGIAEPSICARTCGCGCVGEGVGGVGIRVRRCQECTCVYIHMCIYIYVCT